MYIHKKRFRTPFLTLQNHFENRPSTRLNFLEHLRMSHTETFFRPNIFKTYTETFFETHTDTLKKMKKSLETRCHTLLFWLGKLSKTFQRILSVKGVPPPYPLTDNHIAYGIDQVRDMKKIMTNQCNEKLHCSDSCPCNLRTLLDSFSLAVLLDPLIRRQS